MNHDATPRHGTRWRDTWPFTTRDLARFVVAYLVVSGAFIALGWPLRHASERTGIGGLDHRISVWFVEHRSTTANALTFLGSSLANTPVKVIVTSVIVVLMLRHWHRWYEAAYVAVALVLEASAFITITLVVRRPRPDVAHLGSSQVDSSFPSGHTAAAVVYGAIAVVVFWHTRRRAARVAAVVGAVLVPIVVGVSRVQRGLHHPSDVVAGAVLGLVCLAITTRITMRAQARWEATTELSPASLPPATAPVPAAPPSS